jgi:hypothetical protein
MKNWDYLMNVHSEHGYLRQILNVLFALTQAFAPFFSEFTGIGKTIEAQAAADASANPEVPAGYAFSIWFIIFALSVIYAIYQALPHQRDNKLFQRIGVLTEIAFFLSTAWMLIVQIYGDGWVLVAIIIMMLISTLQAFFRFVKCPEPLNAFDRWVIAPLLGLFSGWLSVAAFLNTASMLKASSLHTLSLPTNLFAIIVISSTAVLSLTVIFKSKGNLWYGATILWALVGIIFANVGTPRNMLVTVFAGCLCVIVTVTLFYSRRQFALAQKSK